MMNFDGPEVAKEFEEAFGVPITQLTQAQLWWLSKFAKHVRGRCRSNAALYNYMGRNFPHATWRDETKVGATGTEYEGMKITMK